ncbi:MAG: hypothetical protein UV79_C0004G0014 [candidate division TM6 bacterium GW2011_GWF2_43_17]|nr:MAG: hypothetical protein UV79_C0004G0014 [candidate division TM6 bacterium GW2011_GWF2_43_17]HAU30513.1 hypothetical protein [Candidatus Dependentiae bacterium]
MNKYLSLLLIATLSLAGLQAKEDPDEEYNSDVSSIEISSDSDNESDNESGQESSSSEDEGYFYVPIAPTQQPVPSFQELNHSLQSSNQQAQFNDNEESTTPVDQIRGPATTPPPIQRRIIRRRIRHDAIIPTPPSFFSFSPEEDTDEENEEETNIETPPVNHVEGFYSQRLANMYRQIQQATNHAIHLTQITAMLSAQNPQGTAQSQPNTNNQDQTTARSQNQQRGLAPAQQNALNLYFNFVMSAMRHNNQNLPS